MNPDKISEVYDLLCEYLNEHPEHDQGDVRVFQATEILESVLNERKRILKFS